MSLKKRETVAYIRNDNRTYVTKTEKYIKFFRKCFIKVGLEIIENGIIIVIPKYNIYNKKTTQKIINQINLYIKKYDIDYLVFDENLRYLEEFFSSNNILKGKALMKELLVEILEYIFSINGQNMNLENIYIFVNKYTKNNIYIINKLITKFKTVNLITENLRYYQRLEASLYNDGILITVSNNKKKSAKNAKYIINMDFDKDTFEKYNINMNSIIINLTDELEFFKNSLKGVLVNNFELQINEDDKNFINEFYGNINKKIYLESLLYSEEQDHTKIAKSYKQCGSKVCILTGVRGMLQKCEFLV